MFLGLRLLYFVLSVGGGGEGWAKNNIIFRGLRLLKILNGPDGPRFRSLHLPKGSPLFQAAPQMSDDFLRSHTQHSFRFISQPPGSPF